MKNTIVIELHNFPIYSHSTINYDHLAGTLFVFRQIKFYFIDQLIESRL